MVADVRTTLRDVNRRGSLFVTEVASCLAICTRSNGGPEDGVRPTSKSFLSANFSFYTLTAEEDPPQLRSHVAPFHRSGQDNV